MRKTSNNMEQQSHLVPSEDDWVESVVEVARTCKKLFTRHTCRLCQVYVDQQVAYEQQEEASMVEGMDASSRSNPANWLQKNVVDHSLEVELYRQFLFDEESVVSVVEEREKDTDSQQEELSG